jgi:hypothetical protein
MPSGVPNDANSTAVMMPPSAPQPSTNVLFSGVRIPHCRPPVRVQSNVYAPRSLENETEAAGMPNTCAGASSTRRNPATAVPLAPCPCTSACLKPAKASYSACPMLENMWWFRESIPSSPHGALNSSQMVVAGS